MQTSLQCIQKIETALEDHVLVLQQDKMCLPLGNGFVFARYLPKIRFTF